MTVAPPRRGRKRRRGRVPRPVRRALLILAWLSASSLLAAEIVVSFREILG
jgi:hypothetical protein